MFSSCDGPAPDCTFMLSNNVFICWSCSTVSFRSALVSLDIFETVRRVASDCAITPVSCTFCTRQDLSFCLTQRIIVIATAKIRIIFVEFSNVVPQMLWPSFGSRLMFDLGIAKKRDQNIDVELRYFPNVKWTLKLYFWRKVSGVGVKENWNL